MAKQDVIDAINATIVPNGSKAINADSLRNLLIMMTENAGEGGSGSGDGALRVIVPELMVLGLEFLMIGELTPDSWSEIKATAEAEVADISEYDAAVNAAFAHNANVAQQILEKAKAGQGVSVVLDQTPYFPAALNIQFQIMPQMVGLYEDLAMCAVQPAALSMEYYKLTPEGEAAIGMVGEQLACALNPLASPTPSENSMLYPSNMLIYLNLDGSLIFEVADTDTETETESGS